MISISEFDDLEIEIDFTEAYEIDDKTTEQRLENSYPFLINDILKYIEKFKESNPELALIEIIVQYSFEKKIDLRLIGDAIQDDEYIKSFIKKDSEFHGLLFSDNKEELDW